MNGKIEITVNAISPLQFEVSQIAVNLLNAADQTVFRFTLVETPEKSSRATEVHQKTWNEIETALATKRHQQKSDFLIAISREPLEDNFFSRIGYRNRIALVTIHDWEFYSVLPESIFIAYELISNTTLMLLASKSFDHDRLRREVLHLEESKGCISDVCYFKPDVTKKIKSGQICPNCTEVFNKCLGETTTEAIRVILNVVSSQANTYIPSAEHADSLKLNDLAAYTLQERAGYYKGLWSRNVQDLQSRFRSLMTTKEELSKQLADTQSEIEKATADLERCNSDFHKNLDASYTRAAATQSKTREEVSDSNNRVHGSREGLAFPCSEIEQIYPFPIAYCYRSVRAEMRYSDKWLALYDLYKLTVRYLCFASLADIRDRNLQPPHSLQSQMRELTYASDGNWGKACTQLLFFLKQNDNKESKLKTFLESFSVDDLHELATISRNLVASRNQNQGHGFKVDEHKNRELFERHLSGIKHLLAFVRPLADYALIKPVQIVENLGEKCFYVSKVLMGSNTLFTTIEMVSNQAPETVCQLLVPGTRRPTTLSLHPWIHVDRCEECQREMVFLYDAVTIDPHGSRKVLLREYPSNHQQQRTDLCQKVDQTMSL